MNEFYSQPNLMISFSITTTTNSELCYSQKKSLILQPRKFQRNKQYFYQTENENNRTVNRKKN